MAVLTLKITVGETQCRSHFPIKIEIPELDVSFMSNGLPGDAGQLPSKDEIRGALDILLQVFCSRVVDKTPKGIKTALDEKGISMEPSLLEVSP